MNNCLFINLDHRKDRLEHVTHQLSLIGVKGERFKAVKNDNGAMGCTMSHIKCLELAKERGWNQVFICEDDIVFKDPPSLLNSVDKFLSSNIQWDVLIIGGNNFPPYEKISANCIKVSNCQTTTGYIVKQHYYDTLLENFKQGLLCLLKGGIKAYAQNAIDIYWKSLQKRDNWYMVIPATVSQKSDYSDIEKGYMDNNHLMLDYKKSYITQSTGYIHE